MKCHRMCLKMHLRSSPAKSNWFLITMVYCYITLNFETVVPILLVYFKKFYFLIFYRKFNLNFLINVVTDLVVINSSIKELSDSLGISKNTPVFFLSWAACDHTINDDYMRKKTQNVIECILKYVLEIMSVVSSKERIQGP